MTLEFTASSPTTCRQNQRCNTFIHVPLLALLSFEKRIYILKYILIKYIKNIVFHQEIYAINLERILDQPFFFFFSIYLFRLRPVSVAAHGILVAACGVFSCCMPVGSSSLTRDRTWSPCIGSSESYPLDHWGSPQNFRSTFNQNYLFPFIQIMGYILVNISLRVMRMKGTSSLTLF